LRRVSRTAKTLTASLYHEKKYLLDAKPVGASRGRLASWDAGIVI